MKPLIVLIVVSIAALFALKMRSSFYNLPLSGRIGMSVMLLFTAMGHLMFTEGMPMMIPDFITLKKKLVYFTALIEVIAAVGLHISPFRRLTDWLLILFFILILPANIKAAIEQLDYKQGTFDGDGFHYLWFRVPLQFLFILWSIFVQ